MENKNPRDYLQQFHQHAKRHAAAVENKSIAEHNDQVKQKVVGILNKVKASGPELEQLKQTNPKAYESMMELVQTMLGMAKDYVVPRTDPQQAQPMQKAQKALNMPPGSETTGQQKDAKSRPKIKVTRPQGPINRPTEIQARTGETTDPRFTTGGTRPLSRKTYQTVINRGQSKQDPSEEGNNPR